MAPSSLKGCGGHSVKSWHQSFVAARASNPMASVTAEVLADAETALQAFLEPQPEHDGLGLRTLAHAWTSGGGQLQVGSLTVRLLANAGTENYTAGTLHPARGEKPARLELCRVLLEKHGVGEDRWTYWCDEFADLKAHGFQPTAKFPAADIAQLTPTELVRLVMGLRDLARMAQPPVAAPA
jgi:hypothetical protein